MVAICTVRPGMYAVAWRPAARGQPGRWVQRVVVELVVVRDVERVVFDERDHLRAGGRPARSSCRRVELARWAEHMLPGPIPLNSFQRQSVPRPLYKAC